MRRRDFMSKGALAGGGAIIGVGGAGAKEYDRGKILNYNSNMEYRPLGKTGLMVSAVCLGGHWKRLQTVLGAGFQGEGYSEPDFQNVNSGPFLKNRTEVVSRAIDVGINYVDACAGPEILAYAKALKGRRQKMYFGYSWHVRESRFAEFQQSKALLRGLDEGMKEAGLDYIDVWRISLPMNRITSLAELTRVEEGAVEALEMAKKQGKVRFTGVSTHNRTWLASLIRQYPKNIEVVLFPYTAATKELPEESVFDAIKEFNVGVFGIKPFADNSLFVGDSSPGNPHAAEDDRRARMALRYILSNPAISAPIPGLISMQQVDNAAKAVMERRQLDLTEKAELEQASRRMWANLRPQYRWLRDWEYV
ncbi:MAG: aldo/keto reductase [Bryobacteraceae bacterium]|nr:aldo/keto reductase [Bryobacteraceae bacterium]